LIDIHPVFVSFEKRARGQNHMGVPGVRRPDHINDHEKIESLKGVHGTLAVRPFQRRIAAGNDHAFDRIRVSVQDRVRKTEGVGFSSRSAEDRKFFNAYRRHGWLRKRGGDVFQFRPRREEVSSRHIQIPGDRFEQRKEANGVHTMAVVLQAITGEYACGLRSCIGAGDGSYRFRRDAGHRGSPFG